MEASPKHGGGVMYPPSLLGFEPISVSVYTPYLSTIMQCKFSTTYNNKVTRNKCFMYGILASALQVQH